MKTFTNVSARSLPEATRLAQEGRRDGQVVAFAGGGSDLLQQIKDGVVQPDLLVHLGKVDGVAEVTPTATGVNIGGLITLDTLAQDSRIRQDYGALAEAAEVVATPQIRNVGTLAGNLCQRPWCWYYRNGFPCFKAGGNRCFSPLGENQLHAIFGGGPSFIVHPSDTAPAVAAFDATFRIVGPDGERTLPWDEFFVLPMQDATRENDLEEDEILVSIVIPAPAAGTRSTYQKVMDREAWTHAVVSVAAVLEMDGDICSDARIVLGGVAPIPWRVPAAEDVLKGNRITPALARQAGEAAVADARALSKNAYKIPLTRGLIERTLTDLSAEV